MNSQIIQDENVGFEKIMTYKIYKQRYRPLGIESHEYLKINVLNKLSTFGKCQIWKC